MTAGLAPAGDPASCSALGATLLVGACRLEPAQPELSEALRRLGAELQRYAVSLRAVRLVERYAAGLLPPADQPAAVRKAAAARRARADAALVQAADGARRGFEALPRSPNPGKPPAPVDHVR